MDAIAQYAWIGWLTLILVFVIIEMLTTEFTFLMLAFGSVGGLIAGALGVPWPLQIVIAAVLALLLIFTLRPRLLRALGKGSDPARSNIDALLGSAGSVLRWSEGAGGQVKLANGETWTAAISPIVEHRPLRPGERVVVTAIDGATAVVVPAERNTP